MSISERKLQTIHKPQTSAQESRIEQQNLSCKRSISLRLLRKSRKSSNKCFQTMITPQSFYKRLVSTEESLARKDRSPRWWWASISERKLEIKRLLSESKHGGNSGEYYVRRIQSNKAIQLKLSSQDEPAIMSVCLSVSGNLQLKPILMDKQTWRKYKEWR
jgi:hypothetical protein